jgi:hypothetical protein
VVAEQRAGAHRAAPPDEGGHRAERLEVGRLSDSSSIEAEVLLAPTSDTSESRRSWPSRPVLEVPAVHGVRQPLERAVTRAAISARSCTAVTEVRRRAPQPSVAVMRRYRACQPTRWRLTIRGRNSRSARVAVETKMQPMTVVIGARVAATASSRPCDDRRLRPPSCGIVVVDQSDDDRTTTLAPFLADGRIGITERGRGIATARSVGVAEAATELIAMTDDDCEVASDWPTRSTAPSGSTRRHRLGNVRRRTIGAGFVPAYMTDGPCSPGASGQEPRRGTGAAIRRRWRASGLRRDAASARSARVRRPSSRSALRRGFMRCRACDASRLLRGAPGPALAQYWYSTGPPSRALSPIRRGRRRARRLAGRWAVGTSASRRLDSRPIGSPPVGVRARLRGRARRVAAGDPRVRRAGGGGVMRAAGLPILTFHALDDRADVCALPPRVFRRGVERLRARGFRTVALDDVADCVRRGDALPPRAVVITFDDGYRALRRGVSRAACGMTTVF